MSLSMKKDLIAEYKTVISALYPNLKHSSINEVNLEWTEAWKIIENTKDPKRDQKLIILRRQLTGNFLKGPSDVSQNSLELKKKFILKIFKFEIFNF